MIQAKKTWSRLLGIDVAFVLSMPFQKEKILMPPTKSNTSYCQFLNIVQNRGCVNSSFMQTMPWCMRPESLEHFASLIPSESRRILCIRQI
jgi:hypothetical protein